MSLQTKLRLLVTAYLEMSLRCASWSILGSAESLLGDPKLKSMVGSKRYSAVFMPKIYDNLSCFHTHHIKGSTVQDSSNLLSVLSWYLKF